MVLGAEQGLDLVANHPLSSQTGKPLCEGVVR